MLSSHFLASELKILIREGLLAALLLERNGVQLRAPVQSHEICVSLEVFVSSESQRSTEAYCK